MMSTSSNIKLDESSAYARSQPDISYHPDREKWQKRAAQRLSEDPTLTSIPLPEGFPNKIDSPLVWEGKDWKNEAQWVFTLTREHLQEVDDAVKHFHRESLDLLHLSPPFDYTQIIAGLGLDFGHISPHTFSLPTLGPILVELSKELHQGRGFFVLRTIPVDSYSKGDNILIYAGISSYVAGTRGLQDKNGGVLSHIKDLSQSHPKGIGGPAYTTDKQVFHTDQGADVVSLFALQIAAEGGISRISSSWRVYNELAATRPDLINILSQPWPVDESVFIRAFSCIIFTALSRFGRNPPVTHRPLLYYLDSKIIIQYARRYFTGFQHLPRSKEIPPITEAQAEALDTLHFLGERFSLGLNFQQGDIQYINNLSMFHARDGFTDSPEKMYDGRFSPSPQS